MRARTLGTILLALGAAVGLAASLAIAFDIDLTRLPPFLVKVALLKLTFIAALGLLAAGALVLRRTRRERTPDTTGARP